MTIYHTIINGLLLLLSSLAALAQRSGDLDSTFGNNGIVVTDFNNNGESDYIKNVCVTNDSSILTVGVTEGNIAIARYSLNGTLDNSFGIGGKITTNITDGVQCGGNVVVPVNNKKIIVAGYTADSYLIVQYTYSGDIDYTFGNEGHVIIPISTMNNVLTRGITDLKIQADKKIIACGNNRLMRFNENGTPDSSFAENGIATISPDQGAFLCLCILPDGKIIAGGRGASGFMMIRYNTNGSVDSTFGINGFVNTESVMGGAEGPACSILVKPDGKIIAVGYGGNMVGMDYIKFAAYSSNGILDTSIMSNGIYSTNDSIVISLAVSANAAVMDSSGAIYVLCNYYDTFGFIQIRVAKHNPDFTIDTTFGDDGIVSKSIGNYHDLLLV